MPTLSARAADLHASPVREMLSVAQRPGVISFAIARRIVAWVDFFSGRLPLLGDLSKRRGQGGTLRVNELPLVHARWVTGNAAQAGGGAARIERERVVVHAFDPGIRGARVAKRDAEQ